MPAVRLISLLAASGGLLMSPSAFAGYLATSAPFKAQDSYGSGTLPSSSYYSGSVYFQSWVRDTNIDFYLPGTSLSLSGNRTSATSDSTTYMGYFGFSYTYGIRAGMQTVSLGSGTYTMTLTGPAGGVRTISGSLVQTTPKSAFPNPFPDSGAPYYNNPVELSGTMDSTGITSLTLSQRAVAVVPEPATLAALGFGTLALLRRRRSARA